MSAVESSTVTRMTPKKDPAAELANRGRAYLDARAAAEEARRRLHGAIVDAVQAGVSEAEAARIAGVDRMTVRNALGKR